MAMCTPIAAAANCLVHHLESLSFYCKTCSKRICEDCLESEHREHQWITLKKIIRETRQDGHQIGAEIRKMKGDLDKHNDDVNRKEVASIRAQQKRFISMITEWGDVLIEKIQEKSAKSLTTEEGKDIEELASFFDTHVQTAYDNVVMDMMEEYQGLRKRWTAVTSGAGVRFVEGKVLPEMIEHMFGDVMEENVTRPRANVTEVSSFTYGEDTIRGISSTSDREAWTYKYDTKQVVHINRKGEVLKQRNLPTTFADFIVMENDDIVYSHFSNKIIRRISSADVISDVLSTAPLHPDGICRSRDGGMLLCASDSNISNITANSHGEIIHVNKAGRIIRIYGYQNKPKLFTLAWRVAQNMNLDICVVDILDKNFIGVLIVMSVKGKVKCTYKGHPSCREDFRPKDVCCDNKGRILVADHWNHAIHMLSPEGAFLQFLLTEQSTLRHPKALSLHSNTMWIGCDNGNVKVYQYDG